MHYYKFNIPDWTLHTAHLSLVEEAVYFRLINHYYDSEKPIPEETQSVIRRLRLGNYQAEVSQILDEFFVLKDGFWIHKRCEKEIKEFKKKARTNKANGAKGGRPKKKQGLEGNPEKTQSVNSGNPDETLTTNHKPLTTNQELEITNKQVISNQGQASALQPKKPKYKKFVKPSIQEIYEEMFAKGVNDYPEAERFFHYYESNGWKVGKNPMRSWRSAIVTWLKNYTPSMTPPPTPPSSPQTFADKHTDNSWAEGL